MTPLSKIAPNNDPTRQRHYGLGTPTKSSCRATGHGQTRNLAQKKLIFVNDVECLVSQKTRGLCWTQFCIPDFADFARLHPDIEMEILSSGELANLTNREADVAIRVVYDRKTLPLNLHGLKGPELFGGVYMSRDRLAAWRAGAPDPIRWIVISIHGIPDWASEGEVRTTGVPFRTTDAEAQIVAVRQGLGITTLPCFIGDADPLLVRVPGTDLHMYGTLWLLTQGETRKTERVRLFTEFVSRRLAVYAPLLAGLSYRATDAGRSPATLAVDKCLQADIPGCPTSVDSAPRLPSAIRTSPRYACQIGGDPETSQEFG